MQQNKTGDSNTVKIADKIVELGRSSKGKKYVTKQETFDQALTDVELDRSMVEGEGDS